MDLLISIMINVAIVALIAFVLERKGIVKINFVWIMVALALIFLYGVALFNGGKWIPLNDYFTDLQWNWGGKIAAILLWVLALFALCLSQKQFKIAEAGFTFKQHRGAIIPSLVVIMFFIVLQLLLSYTLGNGPDYDAEELWYQATMPGLDEEPMFRGVLLYIVSLAIVSSRINLLGAQINVAGLLLVLLFGLIHGLMYNAGEFHFSLMSMSLTGFYGLILLWLRERTGSLVFPILAHNLVNFAGQFV